MIRMRHLMAVMGTAVLAACASAPVHYYTLVPEPDSAPVNVAPAGFQFELLPVGIPAQNDVPQLVVRQGGQSVALVDGERWIAPLAEEVRSALSVDLSRRLDTQDIGSGLPADGKPVLRIKVDLRRFDSAPGSYALIEATWSVRPLKSGTVLTCSSRIEENVGQGYGGLVAGHQQALAELAGQIASVAPALVAGSSAACPTR
ncbi:PqiC family protein [Dyella mobilis]|uniref:Membrane integrity-associated transporter subunit PqiC n=1 Tax=Dyella mobilis TaxID=1849582 RepID=A0ABS2KLI5_9GAMM|nr:PqiC family protein [Dyella mobilis]MBM7132024.1 membrane integrity-associated transporter subunit PqiC [Dyella mobilis]GLQ95992.1 lipoprotein [Dyella mobilis]